MMKRLGVALAAANLLAACQAPPQDLEIATTSEPSAWMRPPTVIAVSRENGAAVVTGLADPGARVVLRGAGGAAFAAAADREGLFVVRVAETSSDLILTPEVQNGQEAASSLDKVAILASGSTALLRAGGPTRRLDVSSGGLDAVDSDGRALLASGRALAGQDVIIVAGGQTMRIAADAEGRWTVILPPGSGSATIGQETYLIPAMTGEGVSVAGQGRLLGWRTPDGAFQWAWLPSASR